MADGCGVQRSLAAIGLKMQLHECWKLLSACLHFAGMLSNVLDQRLVDALRSVCVVAGEELDSAALPCCLMAAVSQGSQYCCLPLLHLHHALLSHQETEQICRRS